MIDKIIQIIKNKGPVLPSDITKPTGLDTLFAGAHLSQMVDSKKLKITHVKKGGSPFYYLPGQEEQLIDLVNCLTDQEKQVFNLLQKKKILRDSRLGTSDKVVIKTLKDFAVPLHVTVNGNKELFWKFFITPDQEVREILTEMLSKKEDIKKIEKVKPEPVVKKEESKVEKEEDKKKEEVKEDKKEERFEKKEEFKPEKQETLKEESKIKPSKEKNFLDSLDKDIMDKVKELIKQEMEQRNPEPEVPEIKNPEDESDEFFKSAFSKLKEKDISINEYEIIKANSEFEAVISVPSAIGTTEFFCKARNKKRFSDGDLSSAFVKGQSKKLQTLFIGPGDLTKKAQSMLDEDFKNNVFFLKL